jgi:PTH1 family peptidyl-tRNA hydrolase
VVDELARRLGGRWGKHRRGLADVVEGRFGPLPGIRVLLVKPRSYMNDCGGPVASVLHSGAIPVEQLIVVHDELDLDLGVLRVKRGGGDNGHNGLRSIRRSLGTGEFFRVRIGIGRPPGRQDPADYVLKPFSATERQELPFLLDRAADAVETLVREGLEATQNQFNGS